MGINIKKALKKLESLTPEEWEKLRDKIDTDTDKETEEESREVLRKYAAGRTQQTPDK